MFRLQPMRVFPLEISIMLKECLVEVLGHSQKRHWIKLSNAKLDLEKTRKEVVSIVD